MCKTQWSSYEARKGECDVAINIKLSKRRPVDRSADSMNRTWVGWDETASDQVNWDHNRGIYAVGDRVDHERYATLSRNGKIRLVARITGRQEESNLRGTSKKWSLQGEVLQPGDPVREAFLRLPAPRGRNPIAYFDDPTDTHADTFLLTNNPARWEIDRDLLTDWINETNAGHTVEWNWSTGGTTRKIVPGDRAFLLRQGVPVRGIFASGPSCQLSTRLSTGMDLAPSPTTRTFAGTRSSTRISHCRSRHCTSTSRRVYGSRRRAAPR
jgi:hypothetical protein